MVRVLRVAQQGYSDAELDAAIEALEDPKRFQAAEAMVSLAAPRLQRVLMQALESGGWFGETYEAEVLKAATNPNDEERLTAVRTLLAEEARMGMMVGVAVGWALADELAGRGGPDKQKNPDQED